MSSVMISPRLAPDEPEQGGSEEVGSTFEKIWVKFNKMGLTVHI